MAVGDGGIGGLPKCVGVAPTDLAENVTGGPRQSIDTFHGREGGRRIGILPVGVHQCQSVAIEAEEQGHFGSGTQGRNNGGHRGGLALVDDQRVVDGDGAARVDHGSLRE